MKNKGIQFYLMLLIISLSLCGCGIINSKAKKAAQEYIEDKYNQDARIVNVKKNYKFTEPGGGLLPTGIESDDSYNLVMEMEGRKFDVYLVNDNSRYIGYDNYEENLIKTEVLSDIENQLDISCEDVFLSYSELYGKYGTNMIHDAYSDLSSIYENGKCAIIIATYDSISADNIERYAATYGIQDEKGILRIEIIQYRDVIPELSFSSFSDVNDPRYVLDWYTISNGSVTHHGE